MNAATGGGGAAGLPHFAAMCLIWGATWLAVKVGVAAVPPILFAGSRFAVAGLLLLAWSRSVQREAVRLERRDVPRLVSVALLAVAGTYAALFWGMQHVSSGLAAVVNLSLIPIGLFAVGLAHGEERYSHRQAGAVALGVVGLVILFAPSLQQAPGEGRPVGWALAVIVAGTLCYCWGSVLGRPLLRRYPAVLLSGAENLLGGLVLLALAAALEPVGPGTLAAFARPAVLASWAFLVVLGSVVAYTIYLRLLRDWGAARAGMYAFVSPVIAVALGVAAQGERLGANDLVAMPIMLAAAWLAVGGRPAAAAGRGARLSAAEAARTEDPGWSGKGTTRVV